MKQYFNIVLYLSVALGFSSAAAGPKEDLFHAVEVDAANVVQTLLSQGLDPNVRDDKGQVALFLALRGESRQVTALLLAQPAVDVDAVNADGETPLMMAALRGDLTSARQLLARGAAVQREGWTPLHYAATGPEPRMVSLLLDRGASVDALSPNGSTPLMMAARYGAMDSADLLLARGADAGRVNERQLTAADFARAAGREELATRLQARLPKR